MREIRDFVRFCFINHVSFGPFIIPILKLVKIQTHTPDWMRIVHVANENSTSIILLSFNLIEIFRWAHEFNENLEHSMYTVLWHTNGLVKGWKHSMHKCRSQNETSNCLHCAFTFSLWKQTEIRKYTKSSFLYFFHLNDLLSLSVDSTIKFHSEKFGSINLNPKTRSHSSNPVRNKTQPIIINYIIFRRVRGNNAHRLSHFGLSVLPTLF